MTATLPVQTELDWDFPDPRPWQKVHRAARDLRCSEDHVVNLILDGSLDFVIDIKTNDAARPCYRIFRPSLLRFEVQRRSDVAVRKHPAIHFDHLIQEFLRTKHNILTSIDVAAHFNCTERHVLNIAPEFFTDFAAAQTTRSYPRTTQARLIEFIKRRKV
jgi:hypothetical protein